VKGLKDPVDGQKKRKRVKLRVVLDWAEVKHGASTSLRGNGGTDTD